MKKRRIGILLGGGRMLNGKMPSHAKERAHVALAILQSGEIDTLILSGRCSFKRYKDSEAQLYKEYLVKHGANPKKLILEEESRDTIGNAVYSKKILLGKKNYRKDIVLITSDSHMQRALNIFQHVFGKTYRFTPKTSKTSWRYNIRRYIWELGSLVFDDMVLLESNFSKHHSIEETMLKKIPQYRF